MVLRKGLRRYLLRPDDSVGRVGLWPQVSLFGPLVYFSVVGVGQRLPSPYILMIFLEVADAISCRRCATFRGAGLGICRSEKSHWGMWGWECPRRTNSRLSWPRKASRRYRDPCRPHLFFWAARQRPLSLEEIEVRQCESGECRRLATVLRPGITACLARHAARANSL